MCNTDCNVLAFASITIDNALVLTGIRLLNGKKGLFVSMPQNKGKDGKYYDIYFPVTVELRDTITKAVIDEFTRMSTESVEEVPFK